MVDNYLFFIWSGLHWSSFPSQDIIYLVLLCVLQSQSVQVWICPSRKPPLASFPLSRLLVCPKKILPAIYSKYLWLCTFIQCSTHRKPVESPITLTEKRWCIHVSLGVFGGYQMVFDAQTAASPQHVPRCVSACNLSGPGQWINPSAVLTNIGPVPFQHSTSLLRALVGKDLHTRKKARKIRHGLLPFFWPWSCLGRIYTWIWHICWINVTSC